MDISLDVNGTTVSYHGGVDFKVNDVKYVYLAGEPITVKTICEILVEKLAGCRDFPHIIFQNGMTDEIF